MSKLRRHAALRVSSELSNLKKTSTSYTDAEHDDVDFSADFVLGRRLVFLFSRMIR